MKKDIAESNLREIKNVIEERGSVCWLTDGTLLGYLRHGHIIPHDHDTDLGVCAKKFNSKIVKDLSQLGYKIKFCGYPSDGFEIVLHKKGIRTDISFFYDLNDAEQYYSLYTRINEKYDFVHSKMSLKKVKFLDDMFCVPENTEKYVEEKYGKTWNAVIKNWNYISNPFNRINDEPIIVDLERQKQEIREFMKGSK